MSAHRTQRGGEVSELARLLPVPAERDLPDERMLLLREHLMGELHAGKGRGVAGRAAHASGAAGPGWPGKPGGRGGPGRRGGLDWRGWPGRRGGPGRLRRVRDPWWRIWMAGWVAAAGAAALAAAVAVGGMPALSRSPGPSPYPTSFTSPTNPTSPADPTGPTGHRSAARLLSRVANAAARFAPAVANGRQFAYVESQVSFGADGAPAPAQTHERQIWLPVADWCAGGLLVEHGQRTRLTFPPGGVSAPAGHGAPATPVREKCPDRGSLRDPTYRLLQSLPSDPRVLLDRIRRMKPGGLPSDRNGSFRSDRENGVAGVETGGLSPDAVAFGTIGDLIREPAMPPRVGAALYRAAALIPGVTVIRTATDAIGRPGVAVSLSVRGDQQEWIFDRHTYQLLGERDFQNGILVGKTAILGRAIVDRSGELPPGS